MKKVEVNNLKQTQRTVTICNYVPWESNTSRRIWEACRQQTAATNRAIEELLKRPRTPLLKSKKHGTTGLYGLWLEWRTTEPHLQEMLQTIWRSGVALAKTQMSAWDTANRKQAAAALRELEAAANTEDGEEEKKKRSATGKRRSGVSM